MVVGLLCGRAEIVQLCGVGGVYLGGGEREWLVVVVMVGGGFQPII